MYFPEKQRSPKSYASRTCSLRSIPAVYCAGSGGILTEPFF